MFSDVSFYVNIILHWVATAYITSGRKVTEKVMDSVARQDHRSVKWFHNNVLSFSDSGLDVIEEAHQVIANPKSHCTAHYLYDEHDDCKGSLMGRTDKFQY